MKPDKKELLKETIKHIDITNIDATRIIDSMREMSFSSRDTASAADILQLMIKDKESTNWLILAGSTSAGGCMQV
jgi:deoxyhypusine synthase